MIASDKILLAPANLAARLHLLKLLIQRDVATRTAGTLLGSLWMIGQPALQVVGMWFFLDIVLKVRSPTQVPFVEYLLVGMVAWMMANETLQRNLGVLHEFAPMYQRTPFPLKLLPMVPALSSMMAYGAVEMLIVGILVGPWAALKAGVSMVALAVWLLPFSYVLAVLGLFLREARQAIPFVLTLLLYLTPILYTPEMAPTTFQTWLMFNPLADVMALLHAQVQNTPWTWGNLLRPFALWLIAVPVAWILFKRTEPHMREAL